MRIYDGEPDELAAYEAAKGSDMSAETPPSTRPSGVCRILHRRGYVDLQFSAEAVCASDAIGAASSEVGSLPPGIYVLVDPEAQTALLPDSLVHAGHTYLAYEVA